MRTGAVVPSGATALSFWGRRWRAARASPRGASAGLQRFHTDLALLSPNGSPAPTEINCKAPRLAEPPLLNHVMVNETDG